MKVESSYITLHDVHLRARHGVMPQERVVGGDFTVTLRAAVDLQRAMLTDQVADTLNYADLLQVVKTEMEQPSNLLEHAAARIGEAVFRRFPQVTALDIDLRKLNPPMGADSRGAGVELHLINDKTNT